MLRRLLVAMSAVTVVALIVAFSGCTAILGDFEVATGEGGAGKPPGQACAAPNECGSSFCVDGVCCEAACSGTCEACNLPTMEGKCMPVPDGQDPANECPTTPLPAPDTDAGVVLEQDAGGEDAAVDSGASFNFPDGGVATDDNQCAGKCNGKRACGYPNGERTCGAVFCGNRTEQGRAQCDGKGHCVVGSETCDAFSCPDGSQGCKKTCAGEGDCLPTHFCEAASSTCKPKLGNGSACASVAQCQSGYCVSNVCCSDSCNGYPGASCTVPGSVGTCRCDACATGPCKLYYRDQDEDGFGDKYGTPLPSGNGRAVPACVGQPPAGYVANNKDCLDGPKQIPYTNARPDQTGFFTQPYTPPSGIPTFDYDCDDQIQKETPEFIGGTCGICSLSFPFNFCRSSTSCSNENQSAGLACRTTICPKGQICSSCSTDTRTGFTTSVNCGDTRSAVNCGYCSMGSITGTTFPQTQQKCH